MSNIKELITRMCPNGVILKQLQDITKLEAGDRITTAMMDDSYDYEVIGGGTLPTGKYNDFNREHCITISRAGSAGFVNWKEGRFWATDVCFTASSNNNKVNIKYIYYYLKNSQLDLQNHIYGGSMPKLEKDYLWNYSVPIPPIEIQNEIVNILDKFEMHINIINEEQKMIVEQYNYAANKMLLNTNYNKYLVKEICKISKGNFPIQKTTPGEFPMVVTKEKRSSADTYQFDTKAVCVPLVSSRGHGVASLNHVYYQEGKFALGNILCAIEVQNEKIIDTKYLYYYLETTKDYLLVPLMKGGANVSLRMEDIYNVEILVPNISKQNKIVNNLDKIKQYQNILQTKLEFVKEQYEYYRNKLLSFEELKVNE